MAGCGGPFLGTFLGGAAGAGGGLGAAASDGAGPEPLRTLARVVTSRSVAPGVVATWLEAPDLARRAAPLQFVMVHVRGPAPDPAPGAGRPFLGRPFSVAGVDGPGGRIALVYRVIGPATTALAAAPPGTELLVLGPLGRPAPADWTRAQAGRARPLWLIAPGWQVLALRSLAAAAWAGGVPVSVLCAVPGRGTGGDDLAAPGAAAVQGVGAVQGAAAQGASVPEALTRLWDELAPPAPPLIPLEPAPAPDWLPLPAAAPGGSRGAAPGTAPRAAAPGPVARVVAAGPPPFLRQVQAALARTGAEGYLLVDAYMPCGYGTCLGCAVPLRDPAGSLRYVRACREGRWFPAGEVVLE